MNHFQPEEARLLAEVGLLAGARGDLGAARTIFAALEQAQPRQPAPYAGLAMALLNRRQRDEAVRTLDRGLAAVKGEDAADLQALRALALGLGGRTSESVRAIAAAQGHPLARELGTQPLKRS